MISAIIITTALAAPAPLPPVDILLRVGHQLTYLGACTLETDILEPAAVSDSYLTLTDCTFVSETTTSAPSWVIDKWAAYGSTDIDGTAIGECWLIHQELIGNGTKAMTLECKTASAGIKQ